MNTNDFIKRNLIDSFIQKGKQSAKIGEIRMYDGKPYQKQADGRWLRHYGSESEPKKEEPNKDSLIGKEITYTKKYAYGKEGQVTAKVVAVKPDGKVLLSSGDETHTSIIKLKDEKESKNTSKNTIEENKAQISKLYNEIDSLIESLWSPENMGFQMDLSDKLVSILEKYFPEEEILDSSVLSEELSKLNQSDLIKLETELKLFLDFLNLNQENNL